MRLPAVLQLAAGVGIVLVLGFCLVGVEGKKAEERQQKKNELTKPETNKIKPPSILNFFKRLLPEKTMDTIRAAITAKPRPKAKSLAVEDAKSRAMKSNKNKPVPETKSKKTLAPVPSKKIKQQPTRMRTTFTPKTTRTTFKTRSKVTPKVTTHKTSVKPTQIKKQKTGKELKSRQNSRSSSSSAFNEDKPPPPEEMQVLTPTQKSNRLRQELVRETEDNCLAKILCGTKGTSKEKPKNTMVSDTAYLIREFFNIFDFTIDDVREEIQEIDDVNKNAYAAEAAEKKKKEEQAQNDEEDDDDETDDSEEDEIYRKTPTSKVPGKNKYTTRNPTTTTTNTTKEVQKTRTSVVEEKVPETRPMAAQLKTKRPKPISIVEMTTTGDMVLMQKPSSTASSTMNRLGEVVTPSTNFLTSTLMSTSMSGSATLTPVDMPFSIPLKTNGRDDAEEEDDDEEDDNQKYEDDNEEDSSTFHRVTLEELVGDIKLNPGEFEMLRRGRSMKIPVNVKNVTHDKFIQTKLRQMNVVNSQVKKLKIAQRIAKSMREPRQCRQFSQVAQEVLQTCPLTTEVIRFFNTNLKNGTTLEVKRTPPTPVTSGGGLVIVNKDATSDTQQAYFVDNSPQTANTKITSDLKNPSIPSSFNKDEDQYTVYEKRPNPNPQNAHLNQHGQDITKKPASTTATTARPTKRDTDDSDEEQDDEDNSDEEEDEEEDDVGRREEENDDEEEDEEDAGSSEDDVQDDDGEDSDEEEGSEYESSNKKQTEKKKIVLKVKETGDHNRLQGSNTNQPNVKIAIRPKPLKPIPPTPQALPPGVIRVYGVPQDSFDREFGQISTQIGSKPVNLFGDEFIDSPPYKKRRSYGKYGHRTSKKAKNGADDDELEAAENVPFSSRIPKHPPLEPGIVHDGDEGSEEESKHPFENPQKHNVANHGKPLGGIKGGDDDDDDDKKNTSAERNESTEKKDGDDKENSAEEPPVQISTINESPFSPSVHYQIGGGSPQPAAHNYGGQMNFYGGGDGGGNAPPHSQYGSQVSHQYQHSPPNKFQSGPGRRPHAYRPLVRPIQIMPDVNVPYTGMSFRPSRDYMRPGRLYPVYHHG